MANDENYIIASVQQALYLQWMLVAAGLEGLSYQDLLEKVDWKPDRITKLLSNLRAAGVIEMREDRYCLAVTYMETYNTAFFKAIEITYKT